MKLCGLIITPISDCGQGGYEIEKMLTDLNVPVVLVDRPTVEMGRAAAEILLQKPKLLESSVIRSGIRMDLMPKLSVYE